MNLCAEVLSIDAGQKIKYFCPCVLYQRLLQHSCDAEVVQNLEIVRIRSVPHRDSHLPAGIQGRTVFHASAKVRKRVQDPRKAYPSQLQSLARNYAQPLLQSSCSRSHSRARLHGCQLAVAHTHSGHSRSPYIDPAVSPPMPATMHACLTYARGVQTCAGNVPDGGGIQSG